MKPLALLLEVVVQSAQAVVQSGPQPEVAASEDSLDVAAVGDISSSRWIPLLEGVRPLLPWSVQRMSPSPPLLVIEMADFPLSLLLRDVDGMSSSSTATVPPAATSSPVITRQEKLVDWTVTGDGVVAAQQYLMAS